MISNTYPLMFACSKQEEGDGWGMQNVWGVLMEKPKEKDLLGDPGLHGSIIL